MWPAGAAGATGHDMSRDPTNISHDVVRKMAQRLATWGTKLVSKSATTSMSKTILKCFYDAANVVHCTWPIAVLNQGHRSQVMAIMLHVASEG